MGTLKTALLILTIGTVILSCKKEVVDLEKPTITLDEPIDLKIVDIGDSYSVQGAVYDNHELDSLIILIEDENASYDYYARTALSINGSSQNFLEWIDIPKYACVGTVKCSVFTKDTSGNTSDFASRTVQYRDKIDPNYDTLVTQINNHDSLIFNFIKNENGVFDSITVFNFTTTQNLAFIKDTGGFEKTIIDCIVLQQTPQIVEQNLSEVNSNSYAISFKVDLDQNTNYALLNPTLDLTIIEYRTPIDLNVYSSQADNGHHTLSFSVNE